LAAVCALLCVASTGALDACSICSCSGSVVDCNQRNLISINGWTWPAGTTKIDLTYNEIFTIPPGIFDPVASTLNYLDFNHNNITILQGSVFGTSMIALNTIDLTYNNLHSLPAGLFDKTGSLINLGMNYNNIVSIPGGLFKNLWFLEFLDISYNEILHIVVDQFTGLGKVTTLNFSYNNVKGAIPQGTFTPLSSIQTLDFSYNSGVTPLKKGQIEQLHTLTSLSTPYFYCSDWPGSKSVYILGALVCEY
jgi:Leucine-rich repeat (LRR) protein